VRVRVRVRVREGGAAHACGLAAGRRAHAAVRAAAEEGTGHVLRFDAQLHPGNQTAGHDADHNGQWRGHHGARVRSGRFHWCKFASLSRPLTRPLGRPLARSQTSYFVQRLGAFDTPSPLSCPSNTLAQHTRTLTHTTTHKQAHLGVRLKKDGYKVIGADWKRQEYFEEKEFCDEFHEVWVGVWVDAGVGRA